MPQLSQGFYHFVHVTHSPHYQSLKIVLCRFATLLASNNISHSSIKSYLLAIRQLHVAKGLPDPCIANMPKLEGVCCQRLPSTRLPIYVSLMYQLTILNDTQIVKLHLKASKADPFRRGVEVVVGRTYNNLCPVTAMLAYLAMRGSTPGLLFRFQDGRLLSNEVLSYKFARH